MFLCRLFYQSKNGICSPWNVSLAIIDGMNFDERRIHVVLRSDKEIYFFERPL
jgi:hypothetical protein